MCSKDQHPLFPYTEEDKQLVFKELNLTETKLGDAVNTVIDWFEKQPHLIEAGIDRCFVEKTIIISKGSIEKAKRRIDGFYKYISLAPEFIQGREILKDPNSKIWDCCSMVPIAKMLDGKRLHFLTFPTDLPDYNNIALLFRNGFMYIDIRMRYDYWLGNIWVLDFKNIALAHIFSLRPTILRKAALLFQNGLNWRIHAIHIINIKAPTSLAQRVLDFFKQFFSQLIMSRVIVHENVEDLYQHVPKGCLPEDYGGTSPSTTILTENIERDFKRQETIDFLIDCAKFVSNESKRPVDEYSEENIPGSFRKLEVD